MINNKYKLNTKILSLGQRIKSLSCLAQLLSDLTPIIKIPFLLFLFLFITIRAYAQFNESEFTGGRLGGPEQVDNRISEDKDVAETLYGVGFMYPYNDFKEMLKNSIGLGYGFDYSAAYLQATDTMGWDNANSGMVRLFLAWDLVNRNNENKGSRG